MATDTSEAPVAVAPATSGRSSATTWATWLKIPTHYAMVPVRVFKWDDERKELVEVKGD